MIKRVTQGTGRLPGNEANTASKRTEEKKKRQLLILTVLSIVVIILTTILFLPVAAQPGNAFVDPADCLVDGNPYPEPYPYPYPYPVIIPGQCSFIPAMMRGR